MISRFGKSFQRFLHNFAAYGFGQVVNIASQLFSIPIFLHYWTTAEYGEWIILTSIPMLLWTLDNGLSGLAGSRMTVITARGDWAEANEIFRTLILVQGLLSLGVMSITVLIAETTNISAAFGFSRMSRSEAGTVLMVMIGYMLLGFCLGLLRAGYRASMLEARGIALTNCWRLSDLITLVIVLPFGGRSVALACGLLVSVTCWVIIMFIDVRRRCPQVEFALGSVSGARIRGMVVDGLPILAGEAAGALFLQGYPLVVNRLLGPAAVVTLTTIRAASRTLLQAVQMVSFASSPELSRTYGNQDWVGYLRLLKVLLAVTIWAAGGACLGLTLFGPWAVALWTSGKVVVDHGVMFLFALSVAFQSARSACGSILVSTNMHHSFNYVYLALTVAGLLTVTFFERAFGFTGIPLTMVIIDTLLLGWALHMCRMKLTFVPLGSLAVVLHPSFYITKAESLLRRVF